MYTYENIIETRKSIVEIFETLQKKLITIDQMYVDFVKLHNSTNKIFGMDSFYFQNKLIKGDYEYLCLRLKTIENRMYCEYYNLHLMIQEFAIEHIPLESVKQKIVVKKQYPVYKKLQPNIDYGFDTINEIQKHIHNALKEFLYYQKNLDNELDNEIEQSSMGLNIGNLINSTRFSNLILKERIILYTNYLKVFYEQHNKYLNRLLIKSKLTLDIVNEDIQMKVNEDTDIQVSENMKITNNINLEVDKKIPLEYQEEHMTFSIK